LGFALVVSAILIGIAWIGYNLNVVILGGGDIKLLGALSLWLAPLSYLSMLWAMALCGGALAIVFFIYILALKPKTKPRLPYGVPIAFGAIWVLSPALISVPTFA
jgi:prepilin peptidase CpaA